MFKSYGLKPSALSEVLSSLVPVTLEVERKRGDVGFIFSLEHNKMIFIYTEENHVWHKKEYQ